MSEYPDHQQNTNDASSFFNDFPYSDLGRSYYELIWEYLEYYISEDDHVLELCCRTGVDSMHFAEKSIKVTATDPSLNMLDQVLYKSGRRMLYEFVLPMQLDPANVPPPHEFLLDMRVKREQWPRKCSVALCNFGQINEIPRQKLLAEFLWKVLDKDAFFIAVVKNKFCMRESWRKLWKEGYKHALERINPVVGENGSQSWFPAPEELLAHYHPMFEITAVHGLGYLLPPSAFSSDFEGRVTDFEELKKLEVRFSKYKAARWISDYYLIVMRRRNFFKK